MAAPRKIFRIEETAAVSPVAAAPPASATRAADELDAVNVGTAKATQQILAAAEQIDLMATRLAASLAGKSEQELAQEISDLVVGIFEACNFQDLVGQRIAKVMAALATLAQRKTGAHGEIEPSQMTAPGGEPGLHGPRLDGDSGHVSQSEVDALFGA